MPQVIAVVPTFRPDPSFLGHLRALAEQVGAVVVVDDGSGPAADAVLGDVERPGVELIRRPSNAGIAAALNAGVRRALELGAEFVLTIDQDSHLEADYVARCLATFERATTATRLGIVCADRISGAPSIPSIYSPEGLGLVPEAIQSGFVITRECLETAGPFDERLVIDCVDTEFCVRVRDRGFRIAVADGTDIAHSLGEMVPYRPFGIPAKNRNGTGEYQYHSPFRQYYIVRNNIDLVLRFARTHPRWTLTVVKRQIGPALDAVSSGPHRARHLLATTVGAWHGLLRRRGPIPAGLRRALG